MKAFLVFLLCLLVACASVPVEPQLEPVASVREFVVEERIVEPVKKLDDPATRTVKQTGSLGTFVYGLSEDNRLLRVEKTGALWEYAYEDGKLISISGSENFEFAYLSGRLSNIDSGATSFLFRYDSLGRLSEVKGFKETLYMEYDSLNRLIGVKRGVAGATKFNYDKNDRISEISRGSVVTKLFYDDKGRIRNFDADDTKFIIGYWRDNKVISLTGKTFGGGLTVSYGPDYPAYEAKMIYSQDDSSFTSAYPDTLYNVVDAYVYCKYVRRLKDVSFDGISYAFFVNYFKQGLPEYLAMQFACVPYES